MDEIGGEFQVRENVRTRIVGVDKKHWAGISKDNIKRAGVDDIVEVRSGSILKTRELVSDRFNLIMTRIPNYLERKPYDVAKRMIRALAFAVKGAAKEDAKLAFLMELIPPDFVRENLEKAGLPTKKLFSAIAYNKREYFILIC